MSARTLGKRSPCALFVGMQTGVATVESSMETPQKIQNGTTLWPSDSTSGNISEETWNTNSKEYMHPYVHWSVIYNGWDLKIAQVSISRWVDKKAVVHLHNRILLSCKKEGNLLATAWMDLGIIILSEISQSEKDNTTWSHLSVESK